MSLVLQTRTSVGVIAIVVAVASFVAGTRVSDGVAAAPATETVSLASGTSVAISTPPFIQVGKRYAFSWPGGGPQQTHTIKSIRSDGWVEVQVAEENLDPAFLAPGQTPTRWLHAGLAVSIQEMRALPY
jgi:hypothetical protein